MDRIKGPERIACKRLLTFIPAWNWTVWFLNLKHLNKKNMKTIIFSLLLILAFSICEAQKSSIGIQLGYFTSNTDKVFHNPIKSPYLGLSYNYKLNRYFSLSAEPGFKNSGYITKDSLYRNNILSTQDKKVRSLYTVIPVFAKLDIGNKAIVGMDLGFGYNVRLHYLTSFDTPKTYTEALVGLRLGYNISDKLAIEGVYRYSGNLSKFNNQNLNSNYLFIQTRIFL